MMKEKSCKIVGGACVIFGLVLLLACGIFLNHLFNLDCSANGYKYNKNDKGRYPNWNDDDDDDFGSRYLGKRDAYDQSYRGSKCQVSKLTFCAGFGIGMALAQIILSGLLAAARKQNAKLFSIIWCSGHVLICISLLVIFSIDLSYDWKDYGNGKWNYNKQLQHKKGTEIGFLVIIALDIALLIPFIVCVTFLLMKKSDYQDYSMNDDRPEDPIVYRPQ